jgi:hypothetical protein
MDTLIGTIMLVGLSLVVLYWGIKARKNISCGKNCECSEKNL